MRKLFSLIAAVLFTGSMMAADVVFSGEDFTGGSAHPGSEFSITKSGVTVTANRALGTGSELRVFASDDANGTSTLTVAAGTATITSIVGEFTAQTKMTFDPQEPNASDWTIEATKQIRLSKLTVTISDGTPATPAEVLQGYINDLTILKGFLEQFKDIEGVQDLINQADQLLAIGNAALASGNEALIQATVQQAEAKMADAITSALAKGKEGLAAELDALLVSHEDCAECKVAIDAAKELLAAIEWDNNKTVSQNVAAITAKAQEIIDKAEAEIEAILNPGQTISCAEVYDLAKGDNVALNPVVVTYVNGKNVWVRDASGAMLLYLSANATWEAGDILTGVEGVVDIYKSLYEVKPSADQVAAVAVEHGEAPDPFEPVSLDDVNNGIMNEYIILKGIALEGEFTSESSTSINLSEALVLFNKFKYEFTFEAGKTYDILGVVSIYNSNLQVNFISAEESGVAPAPEVVYYLVGTPNGWEPSEAFEFAANPAADGEFMLNTTLAEGDEIKVKGVHLNDNQIEWFPDNADNYVVDAAHAGDVTVYFRPDGQGGEGWHYGYIYVEPYQEPQVPLYDVAEAIAAELAKDDVIQVRGIITKIEFKGKNFAKYGSVCFYVKDASGAEGEFEFFNCYSLDEKKFTVSDPEFDETSTQWAQFDAVTDEDGNVIEVGDLIIAQGKYEFYNNQKHELQQNCYLIDVQKGVGPEPQTIELDVQYCQAIYYEQSGEWAFNFYHEEYDEESDTHTYDPDLYVYAPSLIKDAIIGSYGQDEVTITLYTGNLTLQDNEAIDPLDVVCLGDGVYRFAFKFLGEDGNTYVLNYEDTPVAGIYDGNEEGEVTEVTLVDCGEVPPVDLWDFVTAQYDQYDDGSVDVALLTSEGWSRTSSGWSVDVAGTALILNIFPQNSEDMSDLTGNYSSEDGTLDISYSGALTWDGQSSSFDVLLFTSGNVTIAFNQDQSGYILTYDLFDEDGNEYAGTAEIPLAAVEPVDMTFEFAYNQAATEVTVTPSDDENPWDYILLTKEEYESYFESDPNAVAEYSYEYWGDDYAEAGARSLTFSGESEGEYVLVVYGCNGGVTTPGFAFEFTILAPVNQYYLVGTFNNWTPSSDYVLTANEAAETEEYMIRLAVEENDEFKVVYVAYNEETGEREWTWFPAQGGNYVIYHDYAGIVNVYCRPNYDGNEDWYYNCLYVQKYDPQVIDINIQSDVIFNDYTSSQNPWWRLEAENDEYHVRIDVVLGITTIAGEYTFEDLDVDYTYVSDIETGTKVVFTDGSFTVTVEEGGVVIFNGSFIGNDFNTYNIYLRYAEPTPEQTVDLQITGAQIAQDYYGNNYLYGTSADGTYVQFYLPVDEEGNPVDGEYANGSYIEINEKSLNVYTDSYSVETQEDGSIIITAEILCYGNTLFRVRMTDAESFPQGIEEITADGQTIKVLRNGHVFILRGDKIFNLQGILVK